MSAEIISMDLDSIPSFIHQDLVDLQGDHPQWAMRSMMCRAACRLMVHEDQLQVWMTMQREHMHDKFDKGSPIAEAMDDFLRVMRVCKQVSEAMDIDNVG